MKNCKHPENRNVPSTKLRSKKLTMQQLSQLATPQLDQKLMIQTILSPTTNKLMHGFTSSQKRVIQTQFTKMMKNLKKKLLSPQKADGNMQSKTQRFQFVDSNNCSKQTIKKIINTQRKVPKIKSPTKLTKNDKIKSPNKRKIEHIGFNLDQNNRISQPVSPISIRKKQKIDANKKSTNIIKKKKNKTKSIQHESISSNVGNQNYVLMGDSFVQIDENNFKQMQSEIILQSSRYRNQTTITAQKQMSQQAQIVWKQFFQQKNKFNLQRSRNKYNKESQPWLLNKQQLMTLKQTHQKCRERDNEHQVQYIAVSKNSSQCSSIIDKNFQKILASQKIQELQNKDYKLLPQKIEQLHQKQQNKCDKQQKNGLTTLKIKQEDEIKNKVLNYNKQDSLSYCQLYSECSTPNRPQSPSRSFASPNSEDSIKFRINAINLNLSTNKQILNKLVQTGKISKYQYQSYMDAVMQKYAKQLGQIQKLKQLIDLNQQKIDQIIKTTNEGLRLSQKISSNSSESDKKSQVQSILKHIVGNCANDSTKLQLVQTKNKTDSESVQKHPQLVSHHFQTHFPRSSHQSQSSLSEQIYTFQQFKKDLTVSQQPKHELVGFLTVKSMIQKRIAQQLGLLKPNQQLKPFCSDINTKSAVNCISTSVLSIFSFIKSFYFFLKDYHLDQFLTYVNMPYGYSVPQRLKFMQGYDQQENQQHKIKQIQNTYECSNINIIYGLQEVIRPSLLEQYYKTTQNRNKTNRQNDNYYDSLNNKQQNEINKIHNRMIFDAINEAINQFRPYYHINGCPYTWTTTQKALTYYFIREDCCDQLLDKVQMQVLKWSSSLSGLMIQDSTTVPKNESKSIYQVSEHLSIEQIFEKYTIQTQCQLLQQRQQRIMKQEKIQINNNLFQWQFHDQYKTALLYEVSSYILQDLAQQLAIFQKHGILTTEPAQIRSLYQECGLNIHDFY